MTATILIAIVTASLINLITPPARAATLAITDLAAIATPATPPPTTENPPTTDEATTLARRPDPTETPDPEPTAPVNLNVYKDPMEYNFMPLSIKPIGDDASAGDMRKALIQGMIQDQGYEVKCAAPQWKIKPQLSGEYELFFDLFPQEVLIGEGNPDDYNLYLSNARVPMFRGDEAFKLTNKISSLEAFFGVTNPELEDPTAVNSSGVIQNLTTLGEQCQMKLNNFAAIKKICDRLNSGSTCYLNRVIPQTTIKVLSLMETLNGYKEFYGGYMAEENRLRQERSLAPLPTNFCDDFENTQGGQFLKFGITQEEHKKQVIALNNAPFDMDTLYRIAFLVVAPRQNEEEGGDDIFWFRQSPENINDEDIKAPIIVPFRIPDFSTNKSLALYPMLDSGGATRRVVTDRVTQILIDKQDKTRRQNYATKVNQAYGKALNDPRARIYCPGLYQCEPGQPEGGSTVLYRLLIDMVNGLGDNCDGVGGYIEDAGEISTSTGFSLDTRAFQSQYYNVNPDYFHQDTSQSFDWKLTIDKEHADNGIFADGYENSVEVNSWIIAPLGAEVKRLEEALGVFFGKKTLAAMKKNNCLPDFPDDKHACGVIPERYPIKGGPKGVLGLAASATREIFYDWSEPEVCRWKKLKGGGQIQICEQPKHQVTLTLVESRGPVGPIGAAMGWMVRRIEEVIRPLDVQINCSRTEDLFLGKCSIKPLGTGITVPGNCSATLGFDQKIYDTVLGNKESFLTEIKTRYPETKMTSQLFDFVMEYSKQMGWNPAIFLTLGREETAWGAVGSPHWFGCMAGNPGAITNDEQHAKQQMDCLPANGYNTSMSCNFFMCRYAEGIEDESCVFAVNPEFPINFPEWYELITTPNWQF